MKLQTDSIITNSEKILFGGNGAEQFPLDRWNYVGAKPVGTGVIKALNGDFKVNEVLGFKPSGNGAHLWVKIEKDGLDTTNVVGMLSSACKIRSSEIGFSGLKDRNAITSQWFSVPAGSNPECRLKLISSLCRDHSQLSTKQISANPGKLRRGVHRQNEFDINIRNLDVNSELLEQGLNRTLQQGVPNYFGPQRFGRNGKNLLTAIKFMSTPGIRVDRIARSMALSSARSWIFNQVLSSRLSAQTWQTAVIGDALQLQGTNAYFVHNGTDPAIIDRIARHDIHPTGPLWGKGPLPTLGNIAELEKAVVNEIPVFPEGLVAAGLKQQRRALRLIPLGLVWKFIDSDTLNIRFSLPRGSFATAVLRELINF